MADPLANAGGSPGFNISNVGGQSAATPPPSDAFISLEDNSGVIQLEDGSGNIELE